MIQSISPWSVTVQDRTLLISFPELYHVVSWAPLNGGSLYARSIFNHQVRIDTYPSEDPAAFLLALSQRLQTPGPVVGLMTGVLMERLVRRTVQQGSLFVECLATVGLSNALTVGEPATYDEKPGTINLIVALNQPLTEAALVEAVAMITEAKTRSLFDAKVGSTLSDTLATGTGTDCVAVACPQGKEKYHYCGKHTLLGELLGRVVYDAMGEGLLTAGVTTE